MKRPLTPLQDAIVYLLQHGETLESLGTKASVSSFAVYRWKRGAGKPHKAVARPLLMLAARRRKGTP